MEKVIVKEFAKLPKEKLEKLFNKTVTINENLSDELVKDNKKKKKTVSEPSRRPRTLSNKSSSSSISRKARSLSKRSDSKVKLKTVSYYKAISLMNMNISDKPYREFIKNNFKKIQANYKELITNKKYSKNIKMTESKLLSKPIRRIIRRTLRRRTSRA